MTTGASSDIQQATGLARRMVTEFGMSDKLGPVRYNANEQEIFIGHAVTQQQNVSEETSRIIDNEIRRLIEEGETAARRILTDRNDDLHLLAKALLEYETLSGDEVRALLRGEKITRDENNEPPTIAKVAPSSKRSPVPATADGPLTPAAQTTRTIEV